MSKQELLNSGQDQNSISNAIQRLHLVEPGLNNQYKRSAFVMLWLNEQSSLSITHGLEISTYKTRDMPTMKYEELGFSIGKPEGFPDNVNRIFLIRDMVTYVFDDKRVKMSPISCLQTSEQELVKKIRARAEDAKRIRFGRAKKGGKGAAKHARQ